MSHSCRRDSGREKSDLRSARAADTQRGRGTVAAGKSFSAVQAKEAGALWSALYGKALEWVNKAATSCFDSGRDKHWESQRRRGNKDINYQTALRGDSPRSLQFGSSCRPTSRSLIPAGLLSPKISSLLRTGRNLCFLPFEEHVFTDLSCTSNLIYLPALTEFCSSVPAFISLLQPKNTL